MTASVLVALRVPASPERAFAAFTEEIGAWWVPDALFQITPRGDGVLSFVGGAGGKLIATLPSGKVFTIGVVTEWEPPRRLSFTWRHATFPPGMETRVAVDFEPAGDETRVTVTHFGWTAIPQAHVARHGFPDAITQRRAGEWWSRSLGALQERLADT